MEKTGGNKIFNVIKASQTTISCEVTRREGELDILKRRQYAA